MIKPRIGFIVYGVHKDGLLDPMGTPFIDDKIIKSAKSALRQAEIELVEHELIIATKKEAAAALKMMRDDDTIDGVILFSGTWVWAAHLAAAVRNYAATGKGLLIWTHDGSQGWRPVGGLVMHAGLLEIGVKHKFVYGSASDADTISSIVAHAKAACLKNMLNGSTIGAFGGRGMGQTCGVADPSQWMKLFGIDIDSRDTTELINTADAVTEEEIAALEPQLVKLFGKMPERNQINDRSLRLYLAIKKLIRQECFDFYTIQSFPGLGDDYSATCFTQSMMLEEGCGVSTLGDFNTALSVLLLTKLSSERVYYGDLQHINKATREIKVIGDGAIPPSLASELGPATFAEHGIPTEGKAGGLSVKLICKEGKGVLARIGRIDGKFRMIIATCSVTLPPPDKIQDRLHECGIPFWPHAFVTVDGDIDKFIENWTSEYACLAYGTDILPALKEFCEMTGIEVVLP